MMHQAVMAAIEGGRGEGHVDICTHGRDSTRGLASGSPPGSLPRPLPKSGLLITAYSTGYSEREGHQSVLESAQQAQAKQELAWERELLGLDKPEEG